MRPFFPYYGSKWNIARHYPAPANVPVIEPFAGAAGYSTFYGCDKVKMFDVDPIISGVWDYLIQVTAEEVMRLPDLPNAGDCVDDFDLPQEAKWLIGFWLNRGSAQPKKSRTAYSARSDKGQLNWGGKAKERIASQLSGIRNWTIENRSFEEVPDEHATWFIDPPYQEKGKYYRFSFNDFSSLSEWCKSRSGKVIVCEGVGADWLPFGNLGEFKTTKGKALEVVYLADNDNKPNRISA